MPWASNNRPSLALGVLTTLAKARGCACSAHYPSFDFAARIGIDAYEALAENSRLFGLSEHLFATAVFGVERLRSDDFLPHSGEAGGQLFRHLRDEIIPDFIDQVVAEVLREAPDIVGFSCTFNQIFASLAVARQLKARQPDITILIGGACMHGPMGEAYARAFPHWLDHVFTGEAEESFARYLDQWGQEDAAPIPGVTAAGHLQVASSAAERPFVSASIPDHGDWFKAREPWQRQLPALRQKEIAIPFESSRGCWWGEKSHCTFCGLNNEGMHYRTKPADQLIRELTTLADRHHCVSFMAADNILDHRAFTTWLPQLTGLDLDLRIFYEIKANLSRDKVADLAAAGIRWVQPGIESFSDAVLKLMRKGITGLQNLALLRLTAEFGISVSYNVLVGFPGESEEDYREQIALLQQVHHLPPPSGEATPVQVHRFSPFFKDPQGHGLHNVRPCAYYQHLLPAEVGPVDAFAYFFERDMPPDAPLHTWIEPLNTCLRSWQAASGTVWRGMRLGPGFIEIVTRREGVEDRFSLSRLESTLVILADEVTSRQRLQSHFAGTATHPDTVHAAVDRLLEHGVLVRAGDRLLTCMPYEQAKRTAQLQAWLVRHAPGASTLSTPGNTAAVTPQRRLIPIQQ